jgi:hypothetical protein
MNSRDVAIIGLTVIVVLLFLKLKKCGCTGSATSGLLGSEGLGI